MSSVPSRRSSARAESDRVQFDAEFDSVASTFRRIMLLVATIGALLSLPALAFLDSGNGLTALETMGTVAGTLFATCCVAAAWAVMHYAPRED